MCMCHVYDHTFVTQCLPHTVQPQLSKLQLLEHLGCPNNYLGCPNNYLRPCINAYMYIHKYLDYPNSQLSKAVKAGVSRASVDAPLLSRSNYSAPIGHMTNYC